MKQQRHSGENLRVVPDSNQEMKDLRERAPSDAGGTIIKADGKLDLVDLHPDFYEMPIQMHALNSIKRQVDETFNNVLLLPSKPYQRQATVRSCATGRN